MSLPHFSGRRPLRAIAAATLLAGVLVVPVFADSASISSGVTAGTLTEVVGAYSQPASFMLNGVDHTQTFSIPVAVNDSTGSGLGWKLQMSATVFTSGTDTLATDALNIVGPVTITSGTGTAPTDTLTGGFAVNSTPVEYFGATAATGLGESTITAPMTVFVPTSTLVGSYASTVTLAIASAP